MNDIILSIIKKWSTEENNNFSGMWYGYSQLGYECGGMFSIKELKQCTKELGEAGKIELKSTFNEDGKINGRGWFIR